MYTVHFPCKMYCTVVLHTKSTSPSVAGELGNYFRQYCPNAAQQPSHLAVVIVVDKRRVRVSGVGELGQTISPPFQRAYSWTQLGQS